MSTEQILTKDEGAYHCCNKKKAIGALAVYFNLGSRSASLSAKSIYAHRIPASIFPARLQAMSAQLHGSYFIQFTFSLINRGHQNMQAV